MQHTTALRTSSPPSPTPRRPFYAAAKSNFAQRWLPSRGLASLTVDVPSQRSHNNDNSQDDRDLSSSTLAEAPAAAADAPRQREAVSHGSRDHSRTASRSRLSPRSRWKTREFYAYYLVFLIVVPKMWMAGVQLSRVSNPNYYTYAHRLSPGWMFGWKVDNSDHQWHTIRSNLPMLAGLALAWVVLSAVFNYFVVSTSRSHSQHEMLDSDSLGSSLLSTNARDHDTTSRHATATATPPRAKFIITFALILLFALHGTSVPKMLIILWINFKISEGAAAGGAGAGQRWVPLATWGFNIAVLFANEVCEGYRWGTLWPGLSFLDDEKLLGLLPRWHISWNITMLRLISFNMDRYWAAAMDKDSNLKGNVGLFSNGAGLKNELEKHAADLSSSSEPTERQRASTSHPATAYTFPLYLAYALYPPLYLAGPIMTYNAFISQLLYNPPTTTVSRRVIVGYAGRFVACLLTMELVTHSMYVVAIKDESGSGHGKGASAWEGATPFQLSMVGFWNLIIVWLKLLIPWRFFRLWALMDGIDPPENMVRCMANNYSTTGFWRSWHRSYNLWTVRYLYIPLGGSSRAVLSTLAVFTFVALWHDLSLKLLTWGWVITLFVLPEMACQKLVSYKKYGHTTWYRHLAAFGGVLNVLMMMTANLIGFAIGTEGMSYMWQQVIGSAQGIRFMVVASFCLFVAVQIMFEYREEERRRGISRKC